MIFAGTPSPEIVWQCPDFDHLDVRTLYDLLALRTSVFVVEQNCPYQELDGKDPMAWHVMGHQTGELVATARILPPGVSYDSPSIGRVVTNPSTRGQGLGVQLMEEAVARCLNLFPEQAIEIGAQAHLIDFYGRFGFRSNSDTYLEDGIPHLDMIRPA